MRLLNFAPKDEPGEFRLGAWVQDTIVDVSRPQLKTIQDILNGRESGETDLITLVEELNQAGPPGANRGMAKAVYRAGEVTISVPVPKPATIRDFYAFEEHVQTAHRNRNKEVPAEWYQFPVFYFSNPQAVLGPEEHIPYPAHSHELDYELEVACVIGKKGIDITPEQAGDYILGYTIMNDWSARDIQRLETRVGLGPAKAKDFATSLGPWLVTPDELTDRETGRVGVYTLAMKARVNGIERSCGNWADIHYSFGEMIARASQDVYLYPGDVIGSGTVGTGCLLELTQGKGPWLRPGDMVELEIERLGVLRNQIGDRRSAGG